MIQYVKNGGEGMENTYNIIHVDFKGERIAQKYNLWQYDYNQILQISGLSLPATVEIHFSLTEKSGKAETRVATTENGITQVQIPNELLRNDGKSGNYSIFAFIYVVDEDSGNTEYEIILHVDSRPAPGKIGEDPDESHILDEAVNAVNAAADRAETAEAEARSAADSATAAAESARKSAEAVAQKKNTAISVIQNRQAAAEKAITDHTDAEIARLDRETQASEDRLTKTIRTANDTKEAAENTISEARRVKESLDISVQNATKEKEAVEASTSTANAAKKNLDQSTADANVAKTALDKTIQSADDQNTSLGEKIETSKQLKTDLQTAGEKATQDIHTAGEEERSQMTQIAEQFQESIDALTPDDSVVDGKAWTSKKIIDTLCPEFQETGNPVTCYPVAGYPLDVTVSWEPVQPGSGDPYPGGGGKNLLDISRCVASENEPYGLHVTIDKDVIKIDGVPNAEVVNEGEYQFAVAYATQTELQGKGYKVTAFAEKGIVYRAWGLRTADEPQLAISARLTPGVNTDIQVRLMVSKSEPTVYYPYENIRPIHGRDNVTIERCGENVLDITQLSPNGYNLAGKNQLRPNTTYTFQPMQCGGISFAIFAANNINSSQATKQLKLTKRYVDEGKSETFATPADLTDYPYMWLAGGKNGIIGVYPDVQFSLFIGKTEQKPYDPYQGKKQYIPLAQIIYGGSVDNETGDGLISWNILTFTGTENWIYKEDLKIFYINDKNHAVDTAPVSSHYTGRNTLYIQNYEVGVSSGAPAMIFVQDDRFVAVESWKAYLAAQYAAGTPVQIAYKLAEPIPFQVDGDQIPALKGINNILTDADTVTVTGREDPVQYVDKKFAELSAAIVSSASEAE